MFCSRSRSSLKDASASDKGAVRQDVCIFRHVAAHINVDVGHRMLFRLEFHIENRFLNLCFHCPDRKDSEEGLSSSRQAQWILVAKRASPGKAELPAAYFDVYQGESGRFKPAIQSRQIGEYPSCRPDE